MTVIVPAFATLCLVRAPAVAMSALLTLLGARLAGTDDDLPTALLAAAAVALATAGGNTLNDVHDCQTDRVNRADRPIPSGLIGLGPARVIAHLGLLAAAICSAFLSPWCLAICLANCGLLIVYARHSKGLGPLKAMIVGYLVGSTVLFAALSPTRVDWVLLTLATCAGLATVAREIVKDIEDIAGDRSVGARTMPIRFGIPGSRRVANFALVLAVALSFLPWAAGAQDPAAFVVLIAGAAILGSSLAVPDAGRAQRLIMAGSVVEMAAFLLLGT
ncbi:geranylgeranylglycerol-phosphate geranylgeranyltransferase [Stella humosa]|uniref:Geranylgeranylglycerol-phosphate geranylgeranyltransferase n=1 Tax=Stella humosa TaxID=94 RepID=A0A3N1KHF5_9PROT|nr:UbiA family prenyltransferase [Stella humosa]ROP81003.1 geranylgeranylglycerol-phosphate geranylgeranyltransferase [Stella humosa]BBK29692.1 geranylgeranylglycerol-phosphate geranylgeranyltransferase [Stella humosa]